MNFITLTFTALISFVLLNMDVRASDLKVQKWGGVKLLTVPAAICEPQSLYVLRHLGVENIEINSMITKGTYQGSKIAVFCEPHDTTTRFLVSVQGNDYDVITKLGKRIIEDPTLGSNQTDYSDSDVDSVALSKVKVERIIEVAKMKSYALHKKYVRERGKVSGKITISIIVSPEGKVDGVSVIKSELRAPDLEKQFLECIRSLHFPSASKPNTVEFSMDFLPWGTLI